MAPKRTLSTPLSLDDAQKQVDNLSKAQDLSANTTESGAMLTDNMGHPVSDDQNSLRAGERGPTLMEDFLFREKISHFDHERIPERVVHARGAGAHGYFQLDKSLEQYTHAFSRGVLHLPCGGAPELLSGQQFSGRAVFRRPDFTPLSSKEGGPWLPNVPSPPRCLSTTPRSRSTT